MEHQDRTLASVLEPVVAGIKSVLGRDLVGIYLFGSSVSGGFDPGVSDVDLVVVTSVEVEAVDLAGIDAMQLDVIRRMPEWSDRLEIVYIGWSTLQSFRTSRGSLAVISPGEPFHVVGDVADWLQNWYLVRETGVTLHGMAAAEAIPPIARAEYVAAVARYADWLGNQDLDDAGPGRLAYVVLSLCRALRTVRTGVPCTKQEAAAWAQARMPDSAWLIDTALRSRISGGTTGFDDEPTRTAARELIRSTAEEIARSVPAHPPATT